MKQAEDKYKLHDIDTVIDDIVKLIKKTHSIKQTVKWYNDYKGEDIYPGSNMLSLAEKINEESWDFNVNGNGNDRSLIEMIIGSVFSMGFQQGERYVRKSTDQLLDMYSLLVEKKIIKLPEDHEK